jgi:hypothetical protein
MFTWFEYMSGNGECPLFRLLESYHARNSHTIRFLICQNASFSSPMATEYLMAWEQMLCYMDLKRLKSSTSVIAPLWLTPLVE